MPVRVGRALGIKELVAAATKQGCEERISKGKIVTPWGARHVRFLFNPANRGRYDITDYNDDEAMLESEIQAVERRLGIKLP